MSLPQYAYFLYWYKHLVFTTAHISSTYIKNNNGPRIDHDGTLQVTLHGYEKTQGKTINWFLPYWYDLMMFTLKSMDKNWVVNGIKRRQEESCLLNTSDLYYSEVW